MPLTIAPLGKSLTVKRIGGDEAMKNHLAALGIIEGEDITVLSTQASGIILRVKDSRLAIDGRIASHIMVAVN